MKKIKLFSIILFIVFFIPSKSFGELLPDVKINHIVSIHGKPTFMNVFGQSNIITRFFWLEKNYTISCYIDLAQSECNIDGDLTSSEFIKEYLNK